MDNLKPGIAILKKRQGETVWNKNTVRITVSEYATKKSNRVIVRFTTETSEKITKSRYIIPRIDTENNRIYFEEGKKNEGFKLALISKHSRFLYFTCPETIKNPELFEGTYNIDFDSRYDLYFIDYGDKS